MIRNLILISLLILFWLGLHTQFHWISVYKKKSEPIYMFDVFPETSKSSKITNIEKKHIDARNDFVFAEMMANNSEGIITSIIENTKKFWTDKEGQNSKFNEFIKKTILDLELRLNRQISYEGTQTMEIDKAGDITERYYRVELTCEYEDLIALIHEVEQSNRMYTVHKLVIKNPPEQQTSGIKTELTLREVTIN
jgi:hypothetical protein